jgi:hypothetical protein
VRKRIDDVVWCDRSGPSLRIVDASGEIEETGRNERARNRSWKRFWVPLFITFLERDENMLKGRREPEVTNSR